MLQTECLCPYCIIHKQCTAIITWVYVDISVYFSCLLKQWFNLTTMLLNRSQCLFLVFFMGYSSLLVHLGIFHGSSAAPDIAVDA